MKITVMYDHLNSCNAQFLSVKRKVVMSTAMHFLDHSIRELTFVPRCQIEATLLRIQYIIAIFDKLALLKMLSLVAPGILLTTL